MNNKKGVSREELLSAMALMDGELHEGMKPVVVQAMSQPGPRQEAARATYAIGEFVRDWANEKSAGFDVSDAIMAKIAAEPARPKQAAHAPAAANANAQGHGAVVPFPAGRVPGPSSRKPGDRARVFAIGTAVASMFAAAAAAMVFLSHQTDLKLDGTQASMAKDLPAIDVQVQQVESPNTISVFQVPASIHANGTSVVIWIDDAVGVAP